MNDDLLAFGISAEGLEQFTEGKYFEVWEENEQALDFFLKCCTQWRTSFSGYVGLDYVAVLAVLDIYGIVEKKAELFEDIQIMERAALGKLNTAAK